MKPARIGIDCRKILDYGIGTITANLIENLAIVDPETEYFLFGNPDIVPTPGPNFTTVREKSKRYSIGEAIRLPHKSRKLKLDILHWLHYATSPLKHCKYVVSIHDINHLLMPELLPSRAHRIYAEKMLRLATRVADRIITASNASKAEIIEHLNVPEEKISVVYNGVSDIFKRQPLDGLLARLKTDFELDIPYILYVGSLREHKNVARLLEAFDIVRTRIDNDLTLVIVGEHKKQRAALQKYANKQYTGKYVRFLGAVPHEKLPILYSGAHVFVFPTLYEGFGLPPLEAMACGVPVCMSRLPVLKEVAGTAAAYFDPYDPFDMADVLGSMFHNLDRYGDLTKKGPQRASEFSWKRTAEQTLEVYREVLDQSSDSCA